MPMGQTVRGAASEKRQETRCWASRNRASMYSPAVKDRPVSISGLSTGAWALTSITLGVGASASGKICSSSSRVKVWYSSAILTLTCADRNADPSSSPATAGSMFSSSNPPSRSARPGYSLSKFCRAFLQQAKLLVIGIAERSSHAFTRRLDRDILLGCRDQFRHRNQVAHRQDRPAVRR